MVYKHLNIFFILIILNQLFLFVSRVVYGQRFIPGPRVGQAAVLVGDILYFIGGYYNQQDTMSDFFYSHVESYFSWVDLKSQGVNFPLSSFHTASIGGAYQDSIFIIGPNLVYLFDTKTNTFSVPIIQGTAPPIRKAMNSVSYKGKIYLLNGLIKTDNSTIIHLNNFDILDTINLKWEVGSLVNAPITRSFYTATLVNETIYYIGGSRSEDDYFSMAEISLYDIVKDTWSLKNATTTAVGAIPGPRIGHSAVLDNGRICIYGGAFMSSEIPYLASPKETIALLNTNTLVWTIPLLENPNIPKLAFHSATKYKRMMLISFGNLTNISFENDGSNNKTYLFYLNDFIWNSFVQPAPTPLPSQPPVTKTNPKEPTNKTAINLAITTKVVIGIIGTISGMVILTAGIFGYKWYQRSLRNPRKKQTGQQVDHF